MKKLERTNTNRTLNPLSRIGCPGVVYPTVLRDWRSEVNGGH